MPTIVARDLALTTNSIRNSHLSLSVSGIGASGETRTQTEDDSAGRTKKIKRSYRGQVLGLGSSAWLEHLPCIDNEREQGVVGPKSKDGSPTRGSKLR